MKWLYRILRLFFCPHKWVEKNAYSINRNDDKKQVGVFTIKTCRYCGKERSFKSDFRLF